MSRKFALIQLLVGLLLFVGALAWLANEIAIRGSNGAATAAAVIAAIVGGVGIFVVLDVSIRLYPTTGREHSHRP